MGPERAESRRNRNVRHIRLANSPTQSVQAQERHGDIERLRNRCNSPVPVFVLASAHERSSARAEHEPFRALLQRLAGEDRRNVQARDAAQRFPKRFDLVHERGLSSYRRGDEVCRVQLCQSAAH